MEITTGIQPNCSELVTHLGIKARDEIIDALKKMTEVTGWSVGVHEWIGESRYVVIPIANEYLDEVLELAESDGETIIRANVNKLLFLHALDSVGPDQLDINAQCAALQEKFGRYFTFEGQTPWISLIQNCPKHPAIVDEELTHLEIYAQCDCDIEGLTVSCTQHVRISEFPGFHKIREAFGSDYEAHDGGTVEY